MNQNLKPLYQRSSGSALEFTLQATRGFPAPASTPAFVAWPLNVAHVQLLVRFARTHALGVSVAGTGHDYLSRHSRKDSIFIRTSLMKGVEWHTDNKGAGSVRLGPGLTFMEIFKSASEQPQLSFIASGWAQTVGIIGWSLGGGHGPNSVAKGNGADNILEAELVLADGSVARASADENPDLLWALRGGGGSTWGVVTSITVRAFPVPEDGFTQLALWWNGTMCGSGETALRQAVTGHMQWTLGLSDRWAGKAIMTPALGEEGADCLATWQINVNYSFPGPASDPEFQREQARLVDATGTPTTIDIEGFADNWEFLKRPLDEKILPVPWQQNATSGFITAVNVGRKGVAKALPEVILEQMLECGRSASSSCPSVLIFHDIPGDTCSEPSPQNSTSLSPEYHGAMMSVMNMFPGDPSSFEKFYALGDSSYFSESSYFMEGDSWKGRYWGDNYDALLSVKRRYDPEGFFWCHHCVGSDLPRVEPRTPNVLV